MAKGKYEYWLTPEGLLKIEGWARDGLTDEQIARNMGVAYSTFRTWRDKYSALSAVLKKNKDVADRQVENSLFERALGGTHEVRKTFKVKEKYYDDHGKLCEKEKLVQATDEVYIPGDTTAQIFWLKNRKPDKWRDKREIEDRSAVDKLDMILAGMKATAELEQEKIEKGCIYDDKQSSDKMR
ncbi:hypothetical protein HMPREF1216_01454 [Coprococcus sp. HPP0048]|nr:hypothetical protein HMPREF1216_01454 [Coprococcus sp. HPP0048]